MKRSTVRNVAAYVAAPFLVVVYLNIEKWAEKHGYDQFLLKLIETIAQKFQEPSEAMSTPVSRQWKGYWQRNFKA